MNAMYLSENISEVLLVLSPPALDQYGTRYKAQTEDWEGTLEENNVKFATATGRLNTAEEAIRLKVEEANDLIAELTVHSAIDGKFW